MTERLADISSHIHAVRQVGAVVNAMRGLSGARAQQGRALLAGIRAYAEVSARGISEALRLDGETAPGGPTGALERMLIVFGAEQGFAGAFADRVMDTAAPLMAGAYVVIVGTRSVALAHDRRVEPARVVAMPTRARSVVALANDVVDALYDRLADAGASSVELIVPVWTPGSGVAIERRPLMPLNLESFPRPRTGEPPLTTLPTPRLLEQLAEEYVFAGVCEAAMEAYVAENQARMEAMAAAKRNIDAQLEALSQREHQLRQDDITAEVIELAAAGLQKRRRR
ncbi:MAG: FoF1 ATP synthase subunit gamma [Caulobacteraceae bacterium]